MARLRGVARVIRSKNVGPYMIALDIVFDDRATYERVVTADVISREKRASLYHVKPETTTDLAYYEPGNAIKISMLRPVPSGNFSDADVLGAQQYAPLHDIEIPD